MPRFAMTIVLRGGLLATWSTPPFSRKFHYIDHFKHARGVNWGVFTEAANWNRKIVLKFGFIFFFFLNIFLPEVMLKGVFDASVIWCILFCSLMQSRTTSNVYLNRLGLVSLIVVSFFLLKIYVKLRNEFMWLKLATIQMYKCELWYERVGQHVSNFDSFFFFLLLKYI